MHDNRGRRGEAASPDGLDGVCQSAVDALDVHRADRDAGDAGPHDDAQDLTRGTAAVQSLLVDVHRLGGGQIGEHHIIERNRALIN